MAGARTLWNEATDVAHHQRWAYLAAGEGPERVEGRTTKARKLGVTATVVLALVLAGCTTSTAPAVLTTVKATTLSVPTTIAPPGGDRTTTTTFPPTITACTASQLTVGGFGTSAAAGTQVVTIKIEDVSLLPCSLTGYPQVTYLESAGTPLLVAVSHGSGIWPQGVSKIVLRPGEAASAGFIVLSSDVSARPCPFATSIRVRLPNVATMFAVDTATLLGPGIALCGTGSPVSISPIVKGALLAVSPEVTIPTTTLPTVVVQYKPGLVVPVPSTPCSDSELRAAVLGSGPFSAMGTMQVIVTLSSLVPCRLDGFPTLQFGPVSHPAVVKVQHNGVVGHQSSPRPVAVGTGTPASFLVQFASGFAAHTPGCKETNLLRISPRGTTPSVSVSLTAVTCGQARVTPFEQGDTWDQYA